MWSRKKMLNIATHWYAAVVLRDAQATGIPQRRTRSLV
jgi:hypothetical protein